MPSSSAQPKTRAARGSSVPLRIGSTRQLFLDDRVIGRYENVRRRLHRPQRHSGNPILTGDRPWEQGGSGVDITGGTVLFDEEDGRFKMWYRTNQAILELHPDGTLREAAGAAYVSCYAVSSDGVAWDKAPLGLVEFQGSTANNMLPPGRGGRSFIRRPNLIKDYSEPDPSRRYKMVYLDEVGERFALVTAYSSDGLHWDMNAAPPHYFDRPAIPNGILFGWDPNQQEFVHYHRNVGTIPADVDGRMTRSDLRRLLRSSSPDFERWGNTTTALELGPGDPDNLDIGHLGIMSAVLYTDDLYIGFLDTATSRPVEDVPEELWDPVYKMDHEEHRQELVISRDGLRWTRVAPHWEAFRPGLRGSWDSDHVIPSKPVVRGETIFIYYSGNRRSCKAYLPESPQNRESNYAVGLATLRLDGFGSMEAYAETGWLETRPVVFTGDRLVVNARAPRDAFSVSGGTEFVFEGDRTLVRPRESRSPDPSSAPHGTLRVELRDAAGRPFQGFKGTECDPFTGDSVAHQVTWGGRSDVGRLAGRPVRVRFELAHAALYAFQFRDGTAPEESGPPGSRGR